MADFDARALVAQRRREASSSLHSNGILDVFRGRGNVARLDVDDKTLAQWIDDVKLDEKHKPALMMAERLAATGIDFSTKDQWHIVVPLRGGVTDANVQLFYEKVTGLPAVRKQATFMKPWPNDKGVDGIMIERLSGGYAVHLVYTAKTGWDPFNETYLIEHETSLANARVFFVGKSAGDVERKIAKGLAWLAK